MRAISDKKIVEKIKRTKHWDHDIQFIDGRFIEDAVAEYQTTQNDDLLLKIINNYSIFKKTWARAFAPYCDNDLEAGEAMHDEIIWRSAARFSMEKCRKPKGKAFNAYVVSALLNQLKNHRSARQSHKNYPRVGCPVCAENVYQIDSKHLKHVVDLERYKRMFPRYPLVSLDGRTSCPISGGQIDAITEPFLNRLNGSYNIEDFKNEFKDDLPQKPLICPSTFFEIKNLTEKYPSYIRSDYTEQDFINDYPEFEGVISCPFTGKKMLEMKQEHLDDVFKQKADAARYSLAKFKKNFANATLRAKQVPVLNPYTNKMVKELSPEILQESGKTVMEHLEDNSMIALDEWYPYLITCPFTGRKTHKLTQDDLDELGETIFDFYLAVCKFPLRKWQVKCAICGDYVDNIWGHLEQAQHTYAKPLTLEEFERTYGARATKVVVSTNSFFSNDAGDVVHVADLLTHRVKEIDPMEMADSLYHAAQDDLERRLARAMQSFETLDDVYAEASERKNVNLPFAFELNKSRAIREVVKKATDLEDFDFVEPPEVGSRKVRIMIPGKDTLRSKLINLIENSDLEELKAKLQAAKVVVK